MAPEPAMPARQNKICGSVMRFAKPSLVICSAAPAPSAIAQSGRKPKGARPTSSAQLNGANNLLVTTRKAPNKKPANTAHDPEAGHDDE